MPPKISEHTYDHVTKYCQKCNEETTHRKSVSWGDGKYQENVVCNKCGFNDSKLVSKEVCVAITPLAQSN